MDERVRLDPLLLLLLLLLLSELYSASSLVNIRMGVSLLAGMSLSSSLLSPSYLS